MFCSSSLRSRVNKGASQKQEATKSRPSVLDLFDGSSSNAPTTSGSPPTSSSPSFEPSKKTDISYLIAENERLREDLDEAMMALRRITDHHKARMESQPNVDNLLKEIEAQQRLNKSLNEENMRLKTKVNDLLEKITEAANMEEDEENDSLLDILIRENKMLRQLIEEKNEEIL